MSATPSAFQPYAAASQMHARASFGYGGAGGAGGAGAAKKHHWPLWAAILVAIGCVAAIAAGVIGLVIMLSDGNVSGQSAVVLGTLSSAQTWNYFKDNIDTAGGTVGTANVATPADVTGLSLDQLSGGSVPNSIDAAFINQTTLTTATQQRTTMSTAAAQHGKDTTAQGVWFVMSLTKSMTRDELRAHLTGRGTGLQYYVMMNAGPRAASSATST
jgi:hypothetical protein